MNPERPQWQDDELAHVTKSAPQAESPQAPEVAYSEAAMLVCPACSAELSQHKCKLLCPRCGYYMSCADYY
jgi:Zn finger protein HypA/HybF involved in hydrogenase expression